VGIFHAVPATRRSHAARSDQLPVRRSHSLGALQCLSARHGGRISGRAMVAEPGKPVRFTSKCVGVRDWTDYCNLGKGVDWAYRRIRDRVALLSLQHLSINAEVDPIHTEPDSVRAYDGYRRHRLGLPLYHEATGDGVELCRHIDAAIVRLLPVEFAAKLPPPDGVDITDDSIIRSYAAGYRKRRVFGLALQMGSWIERGLFRICDHVLPLDVRVGAISRTVGENGIAPPSASDLFRGRGIAEAKDKKKSRKKKSIT